PNTLVSDRGTSFTSSEFSEFIQRRGIKHRLVATAASWANGLVERVNRFLKSSLRKVVHDQLNWVDNLSVIQYTINNTYHSTIKCSPSKLLFGYEKRN
ncbi:Pro-Pol polyprotein, partial [Trachymyrmex septentrionalis]